MTIDPTTRRISHAQSAATQAEREAAERVTASQKRIREAVREEETRIDAIRDQYEKSGEIERARGEERVESVRSKGYENLAELKRRIQAEESRMRRDGEKDLGEAEHRYREAILDSISQGETRLKETQKRYYAAEQYERQRGEEVLSNLKADHDLQKRRLTSSHEDLASEHVRQVQSFRKEASEKTAKAIQESKDRYEESYSKAISGNRSAIEGILGKSAREAETLRLETSMKLDAYARQKEDPFYRMIELDAAFTESDDQFVLTAKIPPHERERVNVAIRGNELILSGKRKSEETLQLAGGRTRKTNAYQSYSETFPLNWPVNPKLMTREWVGDSLVVRIPKRSNAEPTPPKRTAERASLQRPNFPASLPQADDLVQLINEHHASHTTKKKPGSTLG